MPRKPIMYKARMHTNGTQELNSQGVAIEAYQTNDQGVERKLGTLICSAGGVRWLGAGGRLPYRIPWKLVKDLFEAFGERRR